MITGQTYDRKKILEQLCIEFELLVKKLKDDHMDSLHQRYIEALYRRDGFYTYQDAEGYFEARIHAIEPSGRIVLERKDRRLSGYDLKEVAFVT
jgi:BirA family biotin operon repressor/biotin-[acetyl-CoA-carboxylase] ligase